MKIESTLCILAAILVAACLYIPVDGYSVVSFDVSAQSGSPADITFSNDGTRMFIIGGATVYEYALTTPFDVSTSTPTQSFILGQDVSHNGIKFSNDGTKMFTIGAQFGNVYEYVLSMPYNVTTSTFSRSLDISEQANVDQHGIAFSNNGTQMFILGRSIIYEYALSVPFNIKNSTFVSDYSLTPTVPLIFGITFSNNGEKMFISSSDTSSVHEYILSAPFNIDFDPTPIDFFNVTSQDTAPSGVAFSNDGTKMFVTGLNTERVYEYTLPAPFDFVDTDPPTFTARSDSSVRTIVTFSERVNGTLNLSDWRFDGNISTEVVGHTDGDTLSGIFELVFIHGITNDGTPNVAYTGSNLSDSNSFGLAITTVTATDGISPTFTAQSDSSAQTTVTFDERVSGTLTFSEWSIAGNTPTAVMEHNNGDVLSDITELVFTHDIINDSMPDVEYMGTSITDGSSNMMAMATVTATDGIPPTFTARSDSFTQITITFDERVSGTLTFSEWSIAGNTPTAVMEHNNGDVLSDITELVFTHDIINDSMPDVEYMGTSITDGSSNMMAIATVVATDGIMSTFTARSDSFTRTIVTFDDAINGTLNLSDWSFDGNVPTAVSGHINGNIIFNVIELVFIHTVTNKQTPDVKYTGNSLTGKDFAVIDAITILAFDGISSTFTTRSDFATQTTVTFDENVSGILRFSEWMFTGNTPTAVSGYSDNDNLSAVRELVFTHDSASQTPIVTYAGTSLADGSSNSVAAATVAISASLSVVSVSVSSEDNTPTDVEFSNDGTKMFIVGQQNNRVYEYALSVPFDVTGSTLSTSFSVSSQDGNPRGIAVSNNGEKMFIAGLTSNRIYEYALSVPFNVTSSTFSNSSALSTQDSFPTDVTFSNDGRKMFITGFGTNRVYEYALSVPFNVLSFTPVGFFGISSQDNSPQGVAFSNNGTEMFVVGDQNNRVYKYALSVPFDVTRSTFTISLHVSSHDTSPQGITFSNDGTKMFIIDEQNDRVYEYTLPAPFDFVVADPPTFTARSDSFTQTTVTFDERVSGTLTFSEWSIAGNTPTAVMEHNNGDVLSEITELVFTHDTINDSTPVVEYMGTSITDGSSNMLAIATVVATDGIPSTSCTVPDSGNWIITSDCTLFTNYVAPADVIVRNNAVLVIVDRITLDINFTNNNLTVESGSGVLIESGGTIT